MLVNLVSQRFLSRHLIYFIPAVVAGGSLIFVVLGGKKREVFFFVWLKPLKLKFLVSEGRLTSEGN